MCYSNSYRKRRRHHPPQWNRTNWGRPGWRRPKHNIPINLLEYGDRFEAHVYCLGFDKEHVNITISGDMLYIHGQRTPADEYPPFMLQEYPIKSFERSFQLSERADIDGITAQEVDGVIIITVPKTAAAQMPDKDIPVV